jgi:hypothetical protein
VEEEVSAMAAEPPSSDKQQGGRAGVSKPALSAEERQAIRARLARGQVG